MTNNHDRFRFRAWKNGNMIYNDDNYFILWKGMLIAREPFTDAGILMQCTGIKDKNDKLIYEGDILKLPSYAYEGFFTGPVNWNEEIGFCLSRDDNDWRLPITGNHDVISKNAEVIGNIYENSDLIK